MKHLMKKKPKQQNKSKTDLQKKKTLKQQNWNNLQKERIWTQLTKKKKEIRTDLKKEKNLEQSYKKERKRLPNWSTKKKKETESSHKKNLLAYEIKKGININKKRKGNKE